VADGATTAPSVDDDSKNDVLLAGSAHHLVHCTCTRQLGRPDRHIVDRPVTCIMHKARFQRRSGVDESRQRFECGRYAYRLYVLNAGVHLKESAAIWPPVIRYRRSRLYDRFSIRDLKSTVLDRPARV
jgi:hypothetical protein